jgi:hypothetical protein
MPTQACSRGSDTRPPPAVRICETCSSPSSLSPTLTKQPKGVIFRTTPSSLCPRTKSARVCNEEPSNNGPGSSSRASRWAAVSASRSCMRASSPTPQAAASAVRPLGVAARRSPNCPNCTNCPNCPNCPDCPDCPLGVAARAVASRPTRSCPNWASSRRHASYDSGWTAVASSGSAASRPSLRNPAACPNDWGRNQRQAKAIRS